MMTQFEEAYTKAVEKASASTVSISSASAFHGPPWAGFGRRGVGSGVVLDSKGHILTNYHVVDGAERLIVTLTDGKVLSGIVVGGDEETDIAVVKVEGLGIPPAEFKDEDGVKVGQPILAIGNPLGMPGGPTVTSGIVSSLTRSLQMYPGGGIKVIQTDAAVNPGSSGGPLIDLEGRVLGITTAVMTNAEGIGFAIPSKVALDIAKQIIEHGQVVRPWLGITGFDANSRPAYYYGMWAPSGVFIADVAPGSPADRAGIQVGDNILAMGGKPLVGLGDLLEGLRARKVGDKVELDVVRQGRQGKVSVTLSSRPS
jgi:S1-C subfamily serine protease